MRIPRIYTNQTLSENASIKLDPAAAHYVANVLRMKSGRPIILFNGQGGEYEGKVATISKKSTIINVENYTDAQPESGLKTVLGVCLIKNDRMDWLLQKATELGVSTISPLVSAYTEIKLPADRIDKKMQHWQQVVINACQQSGRTMIPTIEKPQTLDQWLEGSDAACKLVLHPYKASPLDSLSSSSDSIALLIGPEGGLSENEVDSAIKKGFSSFTLGPRILRAETAPLTALSILQYRFGDI
ncbi:MAG: 16S rRNA (uracil(1498)-N(3))-methyltransferase [Cellvibrionaceae bacterium]